MCRLFLLLCLLLASGGAAPATQPALTVDQLITHLGDRDPAVREKATRDLTALGTSARPALVDAVKSADPEVAARASTILRSMPWFLETDPPRVRTILRKHGTRPPDERMATVHELLQLPGNQGFAAVLRLLENETDQSLRWAIVSTVRSQWSLPFELNEDGERQPNPVDPAKRKEPCRQLPTDRDDPPVLCLAAAAWGDADREKTLKLYQRAIASADPQSTLDNGELERAFDWVYGHLLTQRRYADAAALLRRKAERPDQQPVAGVPEPVALLFMLHARHGPIDGLAADRKRFYRYQLHPPVLYAMSAKLTRDGHWIAGHLLDRLALDAGGDFPVQARMDLGRFLLDHGLSRSTVRELELFIAAQGPQDTLEEKLAVVNAQMLLSKTNARIGRYAAAGRALDQALALLNAMPDITISYHVADGETKHGQEALKYHTADLNGYYLQDALERDDHAEIARRIRALRDLPLENSEIVQEVVLWLQNNGERAAADEYFEAVEKRLVEAHKKAPTPTAKNQLAWFRARSHRKLDEALKLAQEAVAGEPGNAAYIDTLAEVHFQRGEVEKAIEIERQALAADPGAPEIEAQMRRFLRGRK